MTKAISQKKYEEEFPEKTFWWRLTEVDLDQPMEVGRRYRFHFRVFNPEKLSFELVRKGLEDMPDYFGVTATVPILSEPSGEGIVTYFITAPQNVKSGYWAKRMADWAREYRYIDLRSPKIRTWRFRWGWLLLGGIGVGIGAIIGVARARRKYLKEKLKL